MGFKKVFSSILFLAPHPGGPPQGGGLQVWGVRGRGILPEDAAGVEHPEHVSIELINRKT